MPAVKFALFAVHVLSYAQDMALYKNKHNYYSLIAIFLGVT